MRVLGGQLNSGFSWVSPGLAIAGSGIARINPSTQMYATAVPFGPGISAVAADMPHVETNWVTGSVYTV